MGMTIGRAYFDGPQPANCRSIGEVKFYYNGTFPSSPSCYGGVVNYEFDGDVWVVYGSFYNGNPKIKVTSRYGRVQEGWS